MATTVDSRYVLGLAVLGAAFFCHGTAHAHFVLTSPPAAHEQNGLGDPQKAPPCGDDGTATPTGDVTPYQAGETITITIDETIYHPGHYRIAIAMNDPSELPEEPPVTEGQQACGTTTIMDPAVFPVLADGVFVHDAPFGKPQSIDVTLPDVNCTNCTLQIIQFMSDHGLNVPGGCFYHHCATISIEGGQADGSTTMPSDDTATTDGGDESTTVLTNVTTADDGTDSSGADGSATNATMSATNATGMTTMNATDTDTDTAGMTEDEDTGCSCSTTTERSGLAMLLLVLGVVGVRRRR